MYIFTFCSILTKRSSEKYTTDITFIYYTNRTYFFGSILVYGSLLCLSSAHVMKQEISKGRNYFCFKYVDTGSKTSTEKLLDQDFYIKILNIMLILENYEYWELYYNYDNIYYFIFFRLRKMTTHYGVVQREQRPPTVQQQ